MNTVRFSIRALALPLVLALAACDRDQGVEPAQSAQALTTPKPPTDDAKTLSIDPASSKVAFSMEAPREKIRGRVEGATTGSLHVAERELTRSIGLLTVDLSRLTLFQTVAGEDGTFGAETRSKLQNQHARTWLEISDDAPPADREANRRVTFQLERITDASATDVSSLPGAERKVTATVSGRFVLHRREARKSAKVELTFRYDGQRLSSVHVRTLEPFAVDLAEHDVRPREAFGKLALKTLEMLAPKVAQRALVNIEFTARAK